MDEKIVEIEQLFLEFIPLYHKKLSLIFREETSTKFRCTKNQKRAILLIRKKEGVMISELGRLLDMRKGSLTPLIDSLVENGLVERQDDLCDRRKTLLYLTPAGKQYHQQIMSQARNTYQKLFAQLSPQEIEQCRAGLEQIVPIMRKL